MRRLSLLVTSLSALVLSQAAFAAAFQFYELGTPVIGTAGVGQAALASDASTAYFNPAGMTQLPSSEYLLGAQAMLPYTNFSRNTRNTISGDNGGNAGTITPGLDLYYVYNAMPQLKLGVSLTAPYGGSLSYNNGWAGRYIVQNILFYTFNLNPSIAYQFNQYFSAALGLAIEYGNLHETIALPIPEEPLVDGQVNLKVDNYSAGYNAGVLFTPTSTTKVGIAYRSQITHNLKGDITFLRISNVPSATTSMVMPRNVIVSLAQEIQHFTLLGEFGWANWASMHNSVVHVAGYSSTLQRDWTNTWRLGVGGQYHFTPDFLLQAGGAYDSSPTSSSKRTPDLPMDRQIRIGAGLIYSVSKAADIGFSYEYLNGGNANINNTSSDGVLSGSYSRNYANVFQASVNVKC